LSTLSCTKGERVEREASAGGGRRGRALRAKAASRQAGEGGEENGAEAKQGKHEVDGTTQ